MELHEPGNPQQLMTPFIAGEKGYVAPKCFICGCEAVGFQQNIQSNKIYPVCERHRKSCLDSGKWKTPEQTASLST